MSNPRVAIVGAGIGGLVAALELACHGVEVTVLERRQKPGGKLREQLVSGQPIDSGPTVFTMRPVFEEIFAGAGSSLSDHLTLKPLTTLARHAWSATEQLDLYADIERSADAIGQFAGPNEARRYRHFCDQASRVYTTLESPFIRASKPSTWSLMRRVSSNSIGGLSNIKPFSSLWRSLGRHFSDPRLQQLFGRYATYMGSSPFLAPATLMLIAHVERTGVWSVEGGMYRIVEALSHLASNRGTAFRYASEVKQVVTKRGHVAGLELENGDFIEADAVIMNADAAAVAAGYFGTSISRAVPRVPRSKRSLSAMTWALMARTDGFPLLRHTVFFSRDYASEFDDIFRRSTLPAAPTVYICAQDRETAFTPSPERLFCLVNAPPVGDSHHFKPAEIERCKRRALALLNRCGLSLQAGDQPARTTTPEDFESLFPGTGGALYGPASHGWRASFLRPGAKTRIAGLYLAGGSTHPGAGIPMAALSGRQAAHSLIEDWKIDS